MSGSLCGIEQVYIGYSKMRKLKNFELTPYKMFLPERFDKQSYDLMNFYQYAFLVFIQ